MNNFFGLCLLLSTATTCAAESTPSIEQIVERYIETRGGTDRLNAIESIRVVGEMTMGGHGHGSGMRLPITAEYNVREQRMRFEFEMQGNVGVSAFDGKTGWSLMPFGGKTEPSQMSDEETTKARNQADFLGALVHHKIKGHEVLLLGEEQLEGTDAYKVRVIKHDGLVADYYLDQEHYLPFQIRSSTLVRGRKVATTTTLGDYKTVEGVLFPHFIEVEFAGATQATTYTAIELNVSIDQSRFEMPG